MFDGFLFGWSPQNLNKNNPSSVLGLVDNIEITWLQSFGLGENFTEKLPKQRSPISAETRGALHCR